MEECKEKEGAKAMKRAQLTVDFSFIKVGSVLGVPNSIEQGSEWDSEIFTTAGIQGAFYNEQVIDLTGMSVEHKTFFPESFAVQSGPMRYASPGSQGAGTMLELTFITTSPFDIKENYVSGIDFEQFVLFPGSIGSHQSFETVVAGEWSTYTSSTSTVPAIELYPSSSGRFGSMEPVSSDRLYCYRLIFAQTIIGSSTIYGAPSTKLVLAGMIGEDSDLAYVMRLRRDYQLQNEPDED